MPPQSMTAGVQDMLPQNMAPWLIGYFKPKVFEKWRVQEGLSDLPWNRSQDPDVGGLPVPGGKEHPSLQHSGTQEEPERSGLDKASSLLCSSHTPFCPVTFSHGTLHFIKASKKTLKFNCFFRSPKAYVK